VYIGTLSVVVLAKQQGLIESAAQVLHDLQSNGFHLDDAVIREALERTVKENLVEPGWFFLCAPSWPSWCKILSGRLTGSPPSSGVQG
jgi:hypothetical protein